MSSINTNRRGFLKMAGKGSAMLGLFSAIPFQFRIAEASSKSELLDHEKMAWGACSVNCGSLCGLRVFVKGNRILWAETDNTNGDSAEQPQVRACVRGRSWRYIVHDPKRLKYPMKRVGKRGSGQFKRISWDEAFSIIAEKMQNIKSKYGNEAFYLSYATGVLKGTIAKSWPPGSSAIARLMNVYGGYLNHYNDYSAAQIEDGLDAFYGGFGAGSDMSGIQQSDLLVMFGNNTAVTRMSGGGANFFLMEALEKNKITSIAIDPRLSDTAATRATEWVALRPATDAALVAGIAYVMLQEKTQNQAFLDTYCVGFDRHTLPKGAPENASYRDYVMGTGEDKTPKTPQWASEITGIPASQIIRIAQLIGKAKRPFIVQGWGPQRHSNGTAISRAIATLACMKGIGLPGTNSGAREGSSPGFSITPFPVKTNPVKTTIPMFLWPDAIVRHNEMTATTDGIRGNDKLKAPIKFIWNYGGNMMNQHADFKKLASILEDESKCEFIVEVNITLTSSGKFADILLPDATHFEQQDISFKANTGIRPYLIVSTGAIKPLYETKTVYDMAFGIAKKLNLATEFSEGRTHDEWVKYLWDESRKAAPQHNLPPFETMLTQGIFKGKTIAKPSVAYEDFVKDPKKHRLTTPSGKIEIYSSTIAEKIKTWKLRKGNELHALGVHWDARENYSDPTRKKYPLQCFGYHYKGRTHSSFWESEAIRAVNPQYAWINPVDAKKRNIAHGDTVHIFNDRGTVQLIANVTQRIRPGVVSFPEGGWFKEENGIDVGGCINTLSSFMPTPLSKGNGTHSILVDIKKA